MEVELHVCKGCKAAAMENGDGDALRRRRREQTYISAEAVRRRACMATLGLNGGGEGVELVGLYS